MCAGFYSANELFLKVCESYNNIADGQNTQRFYTHKKGSFEQHFLKLPIYREAAPCLQSVTDIC